MSAVSRVCIGTFWLPRPQMNSSGAHGSGHRCFVRTGEDQILNIDMSRTSIRALETRACLFSHIF